MYVKFFCKCRLRQQKVYPLIWHDFAWLCSEKVKMTDKSDCLRQHNISSRLRFAGCFSFKWRLLDNEIILMQIQQITNKIFSIFAAIFNRNLTMIRVPFTLQGKYVSIILGGLYMEFKKWLMACDRRLTISDQFTSFYLKIWSAPKPISLNFLKNVVWEKRAKHFQMFYRFQEIKTKLPVLHW